MLTVHLHPFASFCQKALVALYELGLPFETHVIEGDEGRAEHMRLWPMGGMPVLVHDGRVVPESSIVIEYLDPFGVAEARGILDRVYGVLEEQLATTGGWLAGADREILPPGWPADQDALEPAA